MRALEFAQVNTRLAEDQPEYETLPSYHGVVGNVPENTGFINCFELTEDEINIINSTKVIWSSQLTFGKMFNPFLMMVNNPFEDPKEYAKSTFDKSDLVEFGKMLLSDIKRRKSLFGSEFNEVHESDIENYLESIKDGQV